MRNKSTRTPRKYKGSVWSVDFDYDVPESDIESFDANNAPTASIASKVIVDTSSPKSNLLAQRIPSVNSKNLDTNPVSDIQRKILLNGSAKSLVEKPESASGAPTILPIIRKKDEKLGDTNSNNIVLPTVGFNFLTEKDTPSKKFTLDVKSKSLEAPIKSSLGKKPKATSGLKFSFQPTNEDDKHSVPILPKQSSLKMLPTMESTGGLSSTPTNMSSKLLFSFNQPTKENQKEDELNEEEEPRRKRRAPAGITIDRTKKSQPAFSFSPQTSLENKGKIEKEITFSLPKEKTPEVSTIQETTKVKPSFSFGPPAGSSTKTDVVSKSSTFSFQSSAPAGAVTAPSTDEKNELSKPAFSFGSVKQAEPLATNEKEAPVSKPLFSFGKAAENPLLSKKVEVTAKPPFSFGTVPAKDAGSSKPSFSFNSTSAPNVTDTSANKPAFTFASTTSNKETEVAQKAAFTFGKASDTKEPNVQQPQNSFSFNKPSSEALPSNTPKESKGFSFGAATSKSSTPFSLDKSTSVETKPAISFGVTPTTNAVTSTQGFSFGKDTQTPTSGFSFNKPNVDKSAKELGVSFNPPKLFSQPPSSGSLSPAGNASSIFNNKPPVTNPLLGTAFGNNIANTAAPASGGSVFGNTTNAPSSSGFSFNFGNKGPQGGTASNFSSSSVFNSNTNNNLMGNGMFNGGQNTFPNRQQPAVPQAAMAPQQMQFHPSSTVNMNFGNVGNANPSAIFSGTSQAPPQMGQPAQPTLRPIARMRQRRR